MRGLLKAKMLSFLAHFWVSANLIIRSVNSNFACDEGIDRQLTNAGKLTQLPKYCFAGNT